MSHTQIQYAVQRAPLFFQEQNNQAFIWTLTRHDNKLGLLQKQNLDNFGGKIQPREPFALPTGTGCRMDLVITHAVKPRKLITDSHGPRLAGLNRVTEEDGSCGRSNEAPCWACCICVINIYVDYTCRGSWCHRCYVVVGLPPMTLLSQRPLCHFAI